MKKVLELSFLVICCILPGGLILLGVVSLLHRFSVAVVSFLAAFLVTGCASVQYQDPAGNVKISGVTTTPEDAMLASASAEAIRAQAYSVRKCADNSQNCGALWGPWAGGYNTQTDTSGGVQWGWANTNQQENKSENEKEEIKKLRETDKKLIANDRALVKALKETNKKIKRR